jgi:mannose-6-phosphate isomerase-like protein (cupin superfamily)
MTGFVVQQADVQQFSNESRTEHFRTTLVRPVVPIDAVRGGWYHLAAGAANPPDVHQVDEIYFITQGSAAIELDGEHRRLTAGDTVLVPAGCHHQLVNDGHEELVLVFLFSPPPAPRGPSDQPSLYRPVTA